MITEQNRKILMGVGKEDEPQEANPTSKKEAEKPVEPPKDNQLRANEDQSQREKKKEEKKKKKQAQNTDDEDELQKELEKKANDTNEDKPEAATKKKIKKTVVEKERESSSPPKEQPPREAKKKTTVTLPGKVDLPGGGLKQKVQSRQDYIDETPDLVMSRVVEDPNVEVIDNPYREEDEVRVSAVTGKKEQKLIQPKIVFGGGPKKISLQKPKLVPASTSNLDPNKPKEAKVDSSSEEDFELEGGPAPEPKKATPVVTVNPVAQTKAVPKQKEEDIDDDGDWDVPGDKSNKKKDTKPKITPATKKPVRDDKSLSDEDWD